MTAVIFGSPEAQKIVAQNKIISQIADDIEDLFDLYCDDKNGLSQDHFEDLCADIQYALHGTEAHEDAKLEYTLFVRNVAEAVLAPEDLVRLALDAMK